MSTTLLRNIMYNLRDTITYCKASATAMQSRRLIHESRCQLPKVDFRAQVSIYFLTVSHRSFYAKVS